jgi:hypothetical protein
MLKLDFEKAIDRIEHSTIMEILKARGFGRKCIKWISMKLESGTSTVLLNGVPGKKILQKRSKARRPSISIFICPSILLQAILNKAMHQGILSVPLN